MNWKRPSGKLLIVYKQAIKDVEMKSFLAKWQWKQTLNRSLFALMIEILSGLRWRAKLFPAPVNWGEILFPRRTLG
jgi:hypothetical protein